MTLINFFHIKGYHISYKGERTVNTIDKRLTTLKSKISSDSYKTKSKVSLSKLLLNDNMCAICRTPFSREVKPRIDHCHKTGKIRKLLCHHCNLGLGFFKDRIDYLEQAIDYLKEHL